MPRSISTDTHEHIDNTAFWKQAYEESEAARAELLDRIFELEQNQTVSRSGLATLEMAANPVVTNKRKRKNDLTAKANSQSKRRAVLATTPEVAAEELQRKEKANEVEEVQSCTSGTQRQTRHGTFADQTRTGSIAFMRHFFNLRQLIVSKLPDRRVLQDSLRRLCHVSAKLISDTPLAASPSELSKKSSAQTQATPDLSSTVLTIRRSYTSILQGLDKLCAKSDGMNEIGSVVYEVIVLFETVLAKISTLVVPKSKDTDGSTSKAKTTRARKRVPEQSSTSSSHDGHFVCQSLAQLAVAMLTTLDPSKEPHAQVMEGCLYAFLNHLGSSLSLAVFIADQPSEQRGMFTGILPPQGLERMSNVDSGTVIRGVQLEAPYLIYILDNVMSSVNGHQELMNPHSVSLFSSKNSGTSSDTPTRQIKEKLQNTLLKGVFGSDDETFCNSLQKPERRKNDTIESSPVQHCLTEQTPEWFTSEVWRILGWNILATDDASR